MIYLDNAASQRIRKKALEVLNTGLMMHFANPSASHKVGRKLLKEIEAHRIFFINSIKGLKKYNFIFTSSATESNNMSILGFEFKEGDVVYISKSEHPSLIAPLQKCEENGLVLKELPLNNSGGVDENKFFGTLDSKTCFVVLSHINNQSGVIQPINRISQRIKEINPKIKIHLDATQSFTKVPVSLENSLIDFMTISSHKLGGPKGIAGLFVRTGIKIFPLLFGGGQEKALRSSTQSYPLISSFRSAAEEGINEIDKSLNSVGKISLKVREYLKKEIPNILFPFHFEENVSPYILTFIIPGISSDIILRHMEQEDIIFSSTSACSSKVKGSNPVFEALGIEDKFHKNVLRVSFSNETTLSEVDSFCEELCKCYKELSYLLPKKK
ncbi:aminotransferase class V-fold PLP-dependent enzyme [Bacteriovoracales bacterium]|nr:aminotransferase class V-fold PLP-dependent enzyme [Bacteriovoracales bacterium]